MISLFNIKAEDAWEYGSKAANLGELQNHIWGVPPGIVLSPDEMPEEGKPFDTHIRNMMSMANSCGLAWESDSTGEALYAVRSSGVAEDGEDSSYAGQHDTFLSVKRKDILKRVEDCRKSSIKAKAYRDAKGEEDKGIAVLIMPMIRATTAGVLFTADPIEMRLDNAILEYVEGVGDKLVSGQVNPEESYTISHATGEYDPSLEDDEGYKALTLRRVYDLGQSIAKQFGKPMDIEWAAADNRVWILQARPITTGGRRWTIPDMKGRPVMPGVVMGKASWVESGALIEDEEDTFETNSILLTRMTEPHMVPLMRKAAGIATEIGGRTCHAAIVSRELQKPCVVGVTNLRAVPNNVQILVDGAAGTVEAVC